MARILTNDKFEKKKKEITDTGRLVKSFNEQHCVTKNTNIIIVGTITPPEGVKNGYFYTAPLNKIYGYIDEARGSVGLKEKKDKLKEVDDSQKSTIVDAIKKILKEQGIAFLDVMSMAIRKEGKGNSCADSDIQYCVLAEEDFNEIFEGELKGKEVKVICNSREAERKYQKLKESIIDLPKEKFLSQRRGKKTCWVAELSIT